MRVTVSHHKTQAEAIKSVDTAIEDLLRGSAIGPIRVTEPQKTWNGSVMAFSLIAKMGLLSNRIHGEVTVTPTDVTIDADLGMLNRLFPENKVREPLEARLRSLLA